VFFEGRYVPLPYRVSVRGNSLFIGRRRVFKYPIAPTIGGSLVYQEQLPPMSGIHARSTWKDVERILVDGRPWNERFALYYGSHFPPDEAFDHLRDAVAKLPFIREVQVVPAPQFEPDARYIRAISKSGEERDFYSSWWDPKNRGGFDYVFKPIDARKFTREKIDHDLGESAKQFTERIAGEEILILSPKHGHHYISRATDRKHWDQIANAVQILKSDLSEDAKIKAILPRLYDQPARKGTAWNQVKELVQNFRPDPQLDAQMRQLELELAVPVWSPPNGQPAGR
jgi:hypothetical protein